jgi:hypothetical protein
MRMNIDELRVKLIAAARKNPPSEGVPYAFEKRILSHLSAAPRPDFWALWGRPLWRAAVSCVVITTLCGFWAFHRLPKADETGNFSQDFEAAVFAPMNDDIEDAW